MNSRQFSHRGQIFSADFVISVVSIGLAIGMLLHSSQIAMDSMNQIIRHENNVVEIVAAGIAQDPPMDIPIAKFNQAGKAGTISTLCYFVTNETGKTIAATVPSCSTVSATCKTESREIFSATRAFAGKYLDCAAPHFCTVTVMTCYREIT